MMSLLFYIQSTSTEVHKEILSLEGWKCRFNMRSVFKSKFQKMFGFKENCKTHTIYSSNANLNQRTEVRFASFFSGGFTTMALINPPERKLVKRTSVPIFAVIQYHHKWQTTTTFLYLVKLDLFKKVFVFVFKIFARALLNC